MKQHCKKQKIISCLLAMSIGFSVFSPSLVNAAESIDKNEVESKSSSNYEPWNHGFRFVDVLNFDPSTSNYAQEMRASVPLQKRNSTFAATQANPQLKDKAKLYGISSSNYRATGGGDGPFNGNMSYDEFSYNLFKFWQYTDMTGAGGRPTTKEQMEYGTIAIPNPAGTNAAHKNGVLSLGEYFVPRKPQYTAEWLYKDENGNFPYAQKLIEIMNYYGFDGYFINQEEPIQGEYVPLFREMLAWMCENGAYIQWYDSILDNGNLSYQAALNEENRKWIYNDVNGKVTDSIFLDYGYTKTSLMESGEYAKILGLDPHETVFMGVEGGQWKFQYDLEEEYNIVDANGQSYTSFAIWGSDWYHEAINSKNRYQVGYQWEAEERERIYFTSATENVGEYTTGKVTRNDISYDQPINFQGFSKYVVEKSVINGNAFVSDFNNGHGMQYFINGKVSRDMEWTNLNLQDILPTWQWWVESKDENRLELDWDYGSKFYRNNAQGEKYAFPYEQIGAYNGGSSLVIYGSLQKDQLVNLYKTDLNVTDSSKLSLTYNKPSSDDSSTMEAVLVFKDNPAEKVYLDIKDSGKKTDGWKTVTLDLGAYAGRSIAAIGLNFSADETVEKYQMNLGRIVITDSQNYTPDKPAGLKLNKHFDKTGEIQLTWDLGDYDTVKNYHVYAVYNDGTKRFVGGAFADNYYIQTLENEKNVTSLEVCAVGVDGSESEAACVALSNESKVSNILTASENNKLEVTWTDPDSEFSQVEVALNYWYSAKESPEKVIVYKGDQKATLPISLEDGTKYVLTITTIQADGTRNESVNYFGQLSDHYCAPYAGSARISPTKFVNLTTPEQLDWSIAYVEINGEKREYPRSGETIMQNIQIPQKGIVEIVVTLEDKNGNKSEPTKLLVVNSKPVMFDDTYDTSLIADGVLLENLHSKIGKTYSDFLSFSGELDLSGEAIKTLEGLQFLKGLISVNLSGSQITEVTDDVLPVNLNKIDLSDCASLTKVTLNNYSDIELTLTGCSNLETLSLKDYGNHALDLSDCVNLSNLLLANTKMTRLDICGLTKLHNFDISNSQIETLLASDAEEYTNAYRWNWQGARLDLSENTNAGKLMNHIKEYFDTTEIQDELSLDSSKVGETKVGAWFTYPAVIKLEKKYLLDGLQIVIRDPVYATPIKDFEVFISSDGENYTSILKETDANQLEAFYKLPEKTYASYIKIESSNYQYTDALISAYGFEVAPKGFTYDAQKPVIVPDMIEEKNVKDDGTTYQTLDWFTESYKNICLKESGNVISSLKNIQWIDQEYLSAQGVIPEGVQVNITASNGEVYTSSENGVFKADQVGIYQIIYETENQVLASTTVTVEHDITHSEIVKSPTCTENGQKKEICGNCGHETIIVLDALGHEYDEGIVTKKPTTTEEGIITYTCTICGSQKTESISKLEDSKENSSNLSTNDDTELSNPNTGYHTNIALCGLILLIGIFGLIVLFRREYTIKRIKK